MQSLRGLRQLDSGKAPSMSKEGTGEPGSGQRYYATQSGQIQRGLTCEGSPNLAIIRSNWKLIKIQIPGLHPRSSGSLYLEERTQRTFGESARICIFKKVFVVRISKFGTTHYGP